MAFWLLMIALMMGATGLMEANASDVSSQVTSRLWPVREACVRRVAFDQGLAEEALWGILHTERGLVGQRLINPDGSLDHGPMQINSLWLPLLNTFGIDSTRLTNHGCLNVRAGAWILRRKLERSRGRIWEAIGRYHSATLYRKRTYIRRVWRALKQLEIDSLLRHINQRVPAQGKRGNEE